MAQVREHAAAVLADLMKGVDEDQARHFLDKAYNEANALHKKRKKMLVFCASELIQLSAT